jgi:hypothetical protein
MFEWREQGFGRVYEPAADVRGAAGRACGRSRPKAQIAARTKIAPAQ